MPSRQRSTPFVITSTGRVFLKEDEPPRLLRPLYNVVMEGILRSIVVAIDNGCARAALVLIYSGMDTMAFSSLRTGERHTRKAFIDWADKYVRFPGDEQLSGIDLYGARCAVLHTYGTDSDLFLQGQCRRIGYMVGGSGPIVYNPQVDPKMVMVSVSALKDAFIGACEGYIEEAWAQSDRMEEILARLETCLHELPSDATEFRRT